jgi:hypothetical protein
MPPSLLRSATPIAALERSWPPPDVAEVVLEQDQAMSELQVGHERLQEQLR